MPSSYMEAASRSNAGCPIWWLAALCFLLGSIVTLAETIYFTHLRGLVGAEDLSRARARLQAGEYGASAAGKARASINDY